MAVPCPRCKSAVSWGAASLQTEAQAKGGGGSGSGSGSGFPMWEIDHTSKGKPNADDSEQRLESFASSVTADHGQCPPSFASLPPLSLTAERGEGESEIPWMVSKCSWLIPVTQIHSIIPMPRPAPSTPSSPSCPSTHSSHTLNEPTSLVTLAHALARDPSLHTSTRPADDIPVSLLIRQLRPRFASSTDTQRLAPLCVLLLTWALYLSVSDHSKLVLENG